jgi:hypothetical protein
VLIYCHLIKIAFCNPEIFSQDDDVLDNSEENKIYKNIEYILSIEHNSKTHKFEKNIRVFSESSLPERARDEKDLAVLSDKTRLWSESHLFHTLQLV